MVAVSGNLTATFDGEVLESRILSLPASNTGNQGVITEVISVIAEGTTREIPFTATWTKSPGSYDRLESDNTITSSVQLSSELKLRFLQNSEDWIPSNPPLKTGTTYIYSIEIVADVGEGSESFLCIDRSTSKELYDAGIFTFDENQERNTIMCRFTVLEPGQIELVIQPEGTSVQPYAKAWNVERDSESSSGNGDDSTSIILFALAGFVALGALLVPLYSPAEVWRMQTEKHTTFVLLVTAILKAMRTSVHTVTLIFVSGVLNSTIAWIVMQQSPPC